MHCPVGYAFVSDLCCIYMLGVSKSHLLYGVHAVRMLYVCMWVFCCIHHVWSACSDVVLCIMLYDVHVCMVCVDVCAPWDVCTWCVCTICI